MEYWQVIIAICSVLIVFITILGTDASEALKYSSIVALFWLFSVIYIPNEINKIKEKVK